MLIVLDMTSVLGKLADCPEDKIKFCCRFGYFNNVNVNVILVTYCSMQYFAKLNFWLI